jgi:hypothetical protein
MSRQHRELLEVLIDELAFLDHAGYDRTPVRRLFEDSPSCPNFGDATKPVPCTECELIRLVPVEDRDEPAACRNIVLNRDGDTPETLFNWGDTDERRQVARNWLVQQIARASLRKAKNAD